MLTILFSHRLLLVDVSSPSFSPCATRAACCVSGRERKKNANLCGDGSMLCKMQNSSVLCAA